MSKAVLITDMPTECVKCNQFAFECCHAMKREIERENIVQCTKPKWCPLRPLPKYLGFKETETETTDWHFGDNLDRADGWNACLDAIVGDYITQEEADLCGVQLWHDD